MRIHYFKRQIITECIILPDVKLNFPITKQAEGIGFVTFSAEKYVCMYVYVSNFIQLLSPVFLTKKIFFSNSYSK